jgi:cysteinyl-tRNA synthetase
LQAVSPAVVSINWNEGAAQRFATAMNDDFGTPEAMAVLFDLASEANRTRDPHVAGLLKALGAVLGLLQDDPQGWLQAGAGEGALSEGEIQALIVQRQAAKAAKDFAQADAVRQQLLSQGVVLKDGPQGTTWERV